MWRGRRKIEEEEEEEREEERGEREEGGGENQSLQLPHTRLGPAREAAIFAKALTEITQLHR